MLFIQTGNLKVILYVKPLIHKNNFNVIGNVDLKIE